MAFSILLHSLRLLGRGGTARRVRPDNGTRRGIACLRTRRGGVNGPAGLPAWRPVGIHR